MQPMTARERQDHPVLTPQQVLRLRGVDLDRQRFDVAILCFRGGRASQVLLDAFPVSPLAPHIFASQAHAGRLGDTRLVILSRVVWGGPMAAILLEELACLGVQVAIGFGAAGSLETPRHIGHVLVADRALCSDGTSPAYTDAPSVGPDAGLFRQALGLCAAAGAQPLIGAVHTTDALYQERPSRVRQWREAGASYVNLETAPFYAASAHCGIRAIYLALVTDYVGQPEAWQHGFWGRENTTDPQIVAIIRQILDSVELH
jgi:uridine phosphorylase